MLLVGLDACPPSLLDEEMRRGSLPNLSRLRETGRWGTVESDAVRFPGSVWPSFLTMADVSSHGVFALLQWDEETLRFRMVDASWPGIVPFWYRIAEAGEPVVALDVPFSSAVRRSRLSTEVLGWGDAEASWAESWPAGLLREMNRRFGRSSMTREVPGERSDKEYRRQLDSLVTDVDRRMTIIEHLASRFDWRLMIVNFAETHSAGHWFWSDRVTGSAQGGPRRVLGAIDAVVPRLQRLLPPDGQLALFSLHGMRAKADLERFAGGVAAHLEPAGREHLARSVDPVRIVRSIVPAGALRRAVRWMPKPVYNRLLYHYTNVGSDWSQRKTVLSAMDAALYAYVRGEGADRQRRTDWLREWFGGMTTPDGASVAGEIIEPRIAYRGDRHELLPDLVVAARRTPLGSVIQAADGPPITAEQRSWQDGTHDGEGFYLQVGPGIEACSEGPAVSIERLAAVLCGPAGIDAQPTA